MDNNQQPKFDPETGRPLTPQPDQQQSAPKFDPETGKPLNPPQGQPQNAPRFDPETGRPLNPPPAYSGEQQVPPQQGYAQPQQFNHQTGQGYIPPQEQPPYVQPQPQTTAQQPANGLAIGSLICGIASLLLCCCTYFSLVLGVIAVVMAVLSKKDAPKMSSMATGGMVCGIIGGGIALIGIIAGIFLNTSGIYQDIITDIMDEFYYY